MKKIVIDTKTIVSKKLNEKRKSNLNESFSRLRKIDDPNIYVKECFNTSIKLINEGYTEKEINDQLLKEFSLPSFGLPTSLGLDKLDFGNLAKEGGLSFLKELGINVVLKFLGVSPGWSTTLSQAFADLNPLDFIRIFKDSSSCTTHAPHIMDALVEVSLRAGVSTLFGLNRNNDGFSGIPGSILGNLSGEMIRNTGLGEAVSQPFCKLIHK